MRKGQRMSEEGKQRLRNINLGKKLSPEIRSKISSSLLAGHRKITEGHKQKLRDAHLAQFCKYGHDTSIVGRYPRGNCKECATLQVNERNWRSLGVLNEFNQPFTLEDYDRHFDLQGGRCKLKTCNTHRSKLRGSLVVDHDHKTGKFRGLLCSPCNTSIVGSNTLDSAVEVAEYLRSVSIP